MATVAMRQLQEIAEAAMSPRDAVSQQLAAKAKQIAEKVGSAVERLGVVPNRSMYAFEVDGKGQQILADDANMPNLLWMPLIGYEDPRSLYPATRKFILSNQNKWYFRSMGIMGLEGLGSPHHSFGLRSGSPCNGDCIWHLGLVMQGMTANDKTEKRKCMQEILASDAATNLLHEGFDPNNPAAYNRDWFGWANSLFAQWMLKDWLPDSE